MDATGTAIHVPKQLVVDICMLQWARENGCPWDGNAFSDEARTEPLRALQWARANGFLRDEAVCSMAA
jgi:hypothetical protein